MMVGAGPFIPLPQIVAEFIAGIGLALLGANAWVLVRPSVVRRKDGRPVPRPPSKTRVWINLAIGALVALWGIGTLVARG